MGRHIFLLLRIRNTKKMKSFYIADGILQGILTVICAVDITHLFIFPGFSLPPCLIFILIFSGIITAVLWGKIRYNKVLKVPQIFLLCNVGLLVLLFLLSRHGWLNIQSDVSNEVCLFFIYSSIYLLLPGFILSIAVLTIRRSIITAREKQVPPTVITRPPTRKQSYPGCLSPALNSVN